MAEEDLKIRNNLVIPGWELWFSASRSGGPGGQHANTSNTAVTLHWSIDKTSILDAGQKQRVRHRLRRNVTDNGVLQVSAADTRSQHRNRKIARERMAKQLKKAIAKKKRRVRTKPTRASKRRRLRQKRHRSRIKKMRKPPKRDDW